MYSERQTQLTLDGFARENGWCPEPHDIAWVDEFTGYVDSLIETVRTTSRGKSLWWKNGKVPTEETQKWIRRQILNEQVMCFASAEYFVTRYGRIRDVEERIIRFKFRLAQQIFLQALAECDDEQTAIQLFILKARQLGISTVVALFFLHRILFRSNTYAIMASVQQQQSEKLGNIIDTTSNNLPFWLPPQKTGLKVKEPKWENGSHLSIQWGTQEVGIAQGWVPSCVHISEIGDYSNPKRTLEEGLFPACHPTRSLFMVLEGTGATSTTWQKEKWDYYSSQPNGRFKPFFIPPACARDLYPHADWLRANPIPPGWDPSDDCRRMRRRAEMFVHSTPYLWKALGQRWAMDKEFMWYWECLYREAVASHSEREFLAQYAPTPEDAFQSKDTPVFSKETIEIVTREATKVYKAYAITGKTILMGDENHPYEPEPDSIDPYEAPIPIQWEASDGNRYEWTLYPLKPFDDSKDENCFDKLLIFRAPEPGAEYAIGIDTASGLNQPNEDRSALSVHINNNFNYPDEQCAAFNSLRVNSPQMSRIAACVAVLFATDGAGTTTSSNPLLVRFVIEQIRKRGDTCQNDLKTMGFYDHHPMHFYDKKGNVGELLSRGNSEGWRTSAWSRPVLLDRFVESIVTGGLILHDPIVLRQLKTFVRKYKEHGETLMEHGVGCKDDAIFANAMTWTTQHDLANFALRLQNRFTKPKPEAPIVDEWCQRVVLLGD